MKPIVALIAALALAPATAAIAQADPAQAQAPANGAAAHETTLLATIAAAQAGTIDYDTMTPEMAAPVRAQEATVVPLLQGLGTVQTVEHKGEVQGAQHFLVVFENAATDWFISLNAEGKIDGLVFRPAE
jgi:hypothetical protein